MLSCSRHPIWELVQVPAPLLLIDHPAYSLWKSGRWLKSLALESNWETRKKTPGFLLRINLAIFTEATWEGKQNWRSFSLFLCSSFKKWKKKEILRNTSWNVAKTMLKRHLQFQMFMSSQKFLMCVKLMHYKNLLKRYK